MKGGVRKRGKKWYYYFDAGTVNGKRKKIERVGGITKKEAQDALRKALNEFENTGNFKTESDISVADYFEYWYENYAEINCKYNTLVTYRNVIDNHIKPSLGIYKLKSLTPSTMQEFLNQKCKDGYSKKTLQNIYSVMNNALKKAVMPYEFIKSNPIQYIKLPRFTGNKNNDLKLITLDEFNKLIERFPITSNYYIPLILGFHTGMRVGEVCALTWDDISFENKTIQINKTMIVKKGVKYEIGTVKNSGSERSIAIGDSLIKILKKHKLYQNENKLRYGQFYTNEPFNFVCTREDGSVVTPNNLKHLNKVACRDLNIDFTFHSLRHTHATMLLESGANIKDIQTRLGHSKISTTLDIYSHITNKRQDAIIDLFENAIK